MTPHSRSVIDPATEFVTIPHDIHEPRNRGERLKGVLQDTNIAHILSCIPGFSFFGAFGRTPSSMFHLYIFRESLIRKFFLIGVSATMAPPPHHVGFHEFSGQEELGLGFTFSYCCCFLPMVGPSLAFVYILPFEK
jgi:hypothetical protein